MRRANWTKLACCLMLTGCLGAEPIEAPDVSQDSEDGDQAEKVINGIPTQRDPYVAMLRFGTQGFCSGSLIAPRVVLTAAHCLDGVGAAPNNVGFGENGSSNRVAVSRVVTQPGYRPDVIGVNDIGVVILAQPVQGVTPKAISLDLFDGVVGQSGRVIGYGHNNGNLTGFGTRRQGNVTVQAKIRSDPQERNLIKVSGGRSGVQSCLGDSGGPLVVTDGRGVEKVVGVTSIVIARDCTGGSFHTRVAAFKDFVLPFLNSFSLTVSR